MINSRTSNQIKSFFYIIVQQSFIISDVACMSSSDDTFDISFRDLAKDKYLLSTLNLVKVWVDDKDCYSSTAFYLACFNMKNMEERKRKLLANPTLRILVQNEEIKDSLASYFKREVVC